MARNKNYAESRIERINIAITPANKDKILTLAAIAKTTTNDLLNRIIEDFIKNNEKTLKKYEDFTQTTTLNYGNTEEKQTRQVQATDVLTDDQRKLAVKVICQFIKENETHFYEEATDLQAESPAYGIKCKDHIAVEKTDLTEVLKAAGLDEKLVCKTFEFKISKYNGKKSYRMLKITKEDFDNYLQGD